MLLHWAAGHAACANAVHVKCLKCPPKPMYFNSALPRQTQLVEGQKGKGDSTMEEVYFKPVLSCHQGSSKYRFVHCKQPESAFSVDTRSITQQWRAALHSSPAPPQPLVITDSWRNSSQVGFSSKEKHQLQKAYLTPLSPKLCHNERPASWGAGAFRPSSELTVGRKEQAKMGCADAALELLPRLMCDKAGNRLRWAVRVIVLPLRNPGICTVGSC